MTAQNTPEQQSTLASRVVKEVYPVSRLVREVRVLLEGSFPLLWVEGEISNLAMPASGHVYFTLKDEAAQVRCAMFKNRNQYLRFTPENGMQVLLRVRVTMYEARGEFQLIAEHMEESGSGALQRAYEALKHRLGEEGLFDQAHKKALPALPNTVGIISSPDGAAVHDILTVLKRRYPGCQIILYPVPVQGEGAAKQIAQAIQLADQRKECDVLIVGRGGGSLEDLWSFNDEQLARVIAACELPIVSAVGHEIDFTIADFVADLRAPTPSAAAELVVPEIKHLVATLTGFQQRLTGLMKHRLSHQQRRVIYLQQRLPRPTLQIAQQKSWLQQQNKRLSFVWQRLYQQQSQKLDFLSARLKHPQANITQQQLRLSQLQKKVKQLVERDLRQRENQLATINMRLLSQLPDKRVAFSQQQLARIQKQLHRVMETRLQSAKTGLAQQLRTLDAVSPLNTLDRGFSITSRVNNGQLVTDSKQVEVGEQLAIRLQRGHLQCEVKEIKHD